ncbi:MAG: Crp/Fnr family transcriptional regulator [Rhodoferax sp.]|nr:Crp/Fnr family transcriptional regulator [Rhodoferax sp.]
MLAQTELVDLNLRQVLWEPGDVLAYVYFPLQGYVSLIATTDGVRAIEVGMVGAEGVLGAALGLGVARAMVQALVQEDGQALRVRAQEFSHLLVSCSSLMQVVGRFTYFAMGQLANGCACVRFHRVEQRLARWLLMSHDRSPGDVFPMTHVFLSAMLGVRRVSVTNAATAMHTAGLIDYHRGVVRVVYRAGLEAAACSCYQRDCESYNAVFSSPIQRSAA